MIFENIIDETFPGWNRMNINGEIFDDLFQVEGMPLWWFYSRFITSHVLPKQFRLQQRMGIKDGAFFSGIYYRSLSVGFQKYFYCNEKMKQRKTKNAATCKISGEKKVLFLTYTNHYDKKTGKTYRIQKLVDLMLRGKKVNPFLLYTDPLSRKACADLNDFDHTIYQYVADDDLQTAKKEAKALAQQWTQIDKTIIFGKEWKFIQPTMDFFFSYEFIYNTFLYYLTCKKIILEQEIKAIVLTSRNGFFEKCMIAAAVKLGIPTVVIQHGLGQGLFSPETPKGVKHAVFGEIFSERLMTLGVAKEDIIITGPLIFDDIVPFMGKTKKKSGKIVLITEPFIEENRLTKETYFQYVEKILDSLQGLYSELIIKLHPREKTKQDYEALLFRKGIKKAVIADIMGSPFLYSTICDASLVVNFLSTVALEAMIMDVPVLTIDPLVGTSHLFENGPYKGGIMIPINGKVQEAVMEALQDSKRLQQRRKETVKEFCYKVDGNATVRMAQEIYRSIAR